MNIQCSVECSFEIGRNRFRIAVEARFRHALCDAFTDVRASAGRVQPI